MLTRSLGGRIMTAAKKVRAKAKPTSKAATGTTPVAAKEDPLGYIMHVDKNGKSTRMGVTEYRKKGY